MNARDEYRIDWRRDHPAWRPLTERDQPTDKRPVRRMHREDRRRGFEQDPMDSIWVVIALILLVVVAVGARLLRVLP